MFLELYVENLALIETANLRWQPGLNVLTGETGAGKSMVIDAVSLLLGGRSSQDYIRQGAESCLVQGTFEAPYNQEIIQKMQEIGLLKQGEDLDELFLAREISRTGKSTCRVNLRPVPLADFRSLSRLLINIHGQMEHMSLLEAANQLALLDAFGSEKHQHKLEKVAAAFEVLQKKSQELKNAFKQETNFEERRQLLSFQISEISAAELNPTEVEELEQELVLLQNSQHLADYAKKTYTNLTESSNPPLTAIYKAIESLEALAGIDASLEENLKRLNNVYYDLEDLVGDIRNYKNSVVNDPYRLDEIENRLHHIKGLEKKYGGDVEYLLALVEKNQAELDGIENREEHIATLKKQEAELLAAYQQEASVLRQLRVETGLRLSTSITQELHNLQMPQAIFRVDILDAPNSALGFDEVVFMISPNPGEGAKPVAKIASGGEMSRIMLSIKVILAKLDAIPTLIFDEIDTGLGGVALVSVAEKLAAIGKYTQAICVTHAPVVAAYANNNLLVSKSQVDNRTITTVEVLDAKEKLAEITRMLAGNNATETTAKQAAELIAMGAEISKN